MKGLLKNNLYATVPNAKVFSIFMFLVGVFAVAVTSQQLVIGYVMVGIIGFSVNAMMVVKNEFVSKWGKYKFNNVCAWGQHEPFYGRHIFPFILSEQRGEK